MAALASSQAVIALEQLAAKYLDATVGPFWAQEITAAAVVAVLYIGRHGLKAALAKTVQTVKAVWAPAPPA